MRCAQIKDGVVINTIEAQPGFDPKDGSIVVASDIAQIGWTYIGGQFQAVVQAPVYEVSNLTFLDFISLFSVSEQVAIMSSTDPQVRLFCLMAASVPALDLTHLQVVGSIQYLVLVGILTANRASMVLAGAPPV